MALFEEGLVLAEHLNYCNTGVSVESQDLCVIVGRWGLGTYMFNQSSLIFY